MRPEDLAHLRKLLEDRLVALYRSAHHEARQNIQVRMFFDQHEPRDEGEEAVRTQAEDLRMGRAESEAALAQRIEEALRRMTRGEYGECIDCGNEIELGRLRAVPWAIRCIECQEALEFEGRDRSPSL